MEPTRTDTRQRWDARNAVPEDLREWVDGKALLPLVFEAIHSIEDDEQRLSVPRRLPAGSQRTFLTILTYSYGTGRLGSYEIERQILLEPELAYLAARTCPSGNELRRFRRLHKILIHRSLSSLIKLAWQARFRRMSSSDGCFWPARELDEAGLEWLFQSAAERRINRAVLIDSMALDD